MRILILGGNGFVGSVLVHAAEQRGHCAIAADTAGTAHTLDIRALDQVETLVDAVKPDFVVNLAAIADVDRAEREHALAWSVNVEGSRNVAAVCGKRSIRHLFFSSDAIFSGTAMRYVETDLPDPVNHYGLTKAAAEQAVALVCPAAVFLRPSLVLGYPVQTGNSYLASLTGKLQRGEEVTNPVDEIRTPVDVHTLVACVLELGSNAVAGPLHIGATGSINRFELAQRIAAKLGYSSGCVKPSPATSSTPGRAARHKNGVLSVARAQALLKTPMLSVDQTIAAALAGGPHKETP
jgi:dTDP-4-dehydrorhamnose reductase